MSCCLGLGNGNEETLWDSAHLRKKKKKATVECVGKKKKVRLGMALNSSEHPAGGMTLLTTLKQLRGASSFGVVGGRWMILTLDTMRRSH